MRSSTSLLLPSSLVVCLVLSFLICVRCDRYDEEVAFTRLPGGNIASRFRFTVTDVHRELGDESYFFPSILRELIEKYSLSELSLTLGRGNWRPELWGVPPQPAAVQGATVHAWFDRVHNDTEVDARWASLVSSLNGHFCTSLSALHPTHSTSLRRTMHAHGPAYRKGGKRSSRYGAIAEETVCTENVTPWRKLLPCRQKGLVGLLTPTKIFHSAFHSLSLHVFLACDGDKQDCASPTWRLSMDAIVVFDADMQARKTRWSVSRLFDRPLSGGCPVATTSAVLVKDDFYKPTYDRAPNATLGGYDIFYLQPSLQPDDDFLVKYERELVDVTPTAVQGPITLRASLVGGEATRTNLLQYTITSRSTAEHTVALSAAVPWYAQLHYATVQWRCWREDRREVVPLLQSSSFTPSLARKRPALLEYTLIIPPKGTCALTVRFDRVFMKMAEYPSDANHGKYIPPALLTVFPPAQGAKGGEGGALLPLLPGGTRHSTLNALLHSRTPSSSSSSSSSSPVLVYSNPVLIALPVPDFSMPFNVEAFVCVVISLCFSPLINYTAYVMIPVGETPPRPSIWKKLFRYFLHALTVAAFYAEINQISPSQITRYGKAAVKGVVKVINETVAPFIVEQRLGIAAQ